MLLYIIYTLELKVAFYIELKEKGFKIATLSPEADQYDIYNLPIDQPIALVVWTLSVIQKNSNHSI